MYVPIIYLHLFKILDLLGPKSDADLVAPSKSEKKSSKPVKNDTVSKSDVKKFENSPTNEVENLTILDVMKKVNFHAPGENYKTDGYIVTEHTHKLLQEHLKITGGKVTYWSN